MSDPIQNAIDQLGIELEAIDQKRGDIEAAIGALTRLAREGLTTNAAPRMNGAKSSSQDRPTDRPSKARANGRAGATLTPRSLPDDAACAPILALLRKRSPMKPGDLASALDISPYVLRARLKNLQQRGLVEVTGATMNRQVALSRKGGAAKEAP